MQKRNAFTKLLSFAVLAIRRGFLSFQNSSKDLDPSYKMNLDFWDSFGREKLGLITKEIW